MKTQDIDAVVIGANIRGLVTTYVLDSLGYRAVLLDKGRVAGGVDGSFLTPGGTRFEHGMHVLDYMRSEVTTRLFTHILDGEVHRVTLKRGIVLRGQLMPYAPRPEDMPQELRAMLPREELVDDLGEAVPTRERLAKYYGQQFTDLIFDEVLSSYPTESRHLEFGVEEGRLLANVYPWLFPRARRKPVPGDASRSFHDRLREGNDQQLLYPREGGFGGFAAGFLSKFDPQRIEVLLDAGDVQVELSPGTHTVEWVEARGRRLRPKHLFWAASWPALCRLLTIPCQDTATDRMMIGSFRLNRPAATDYNEILVGDPTIRINRVYFPAGFRESDEPLMQVEFAFAKAEERPLEREWWLDAWLSDLRRLELIDENHRVEEFDFKTFCMHYNGFGMEGQALRDADASEIQPGSNIRPVTPSMANLNLNGHVPRTIEYVTSVLTDDDGTRHGR